MLNLGSGGIKAFLQQKICLKCTICIMPWFRQNVYIGLTPVCYHRLSMRVDCGWTPFNFVSPDGCFNKYRSLVRGRMVVDKSTVLAILSPTTPFISG